MNASPSTRLLVPAALATALLLAACGTAGGPDWTFAPLGPTPAVDPSPAPTPAGTPVGTVINIELTADLRILRDGEHIHELPVTLGETYTFVVTNTAGYDHDFVLGPPERLEGRDLEGLPGVPVFTTGTQQFTWEATEEAAGWQFACTVFGHYANMHGELVLEGD